MDYTRLMYTHKRAHIVAAQKAQMLEDHFHCPGIRNAYLFIHLALLQYLVRYH